MNLILIYICFIFFGIILFLLWNHKDKFSIGGQGRQENINEILNIIENNCDGKNFSVPRDYAIRGINDDYHCCESINQILQSLNVNMDRPLEIKELLNENTQYMSYTQNKKNNILEYIIGCNHDKSGCGSNKKYLDITYGENDNVITRFRCIDPCAKIPCQNGGECRAEDNYCDCPDGFKGPSCEIRVTESTSTPPVAPPVAPQPPATQPSAQISSCLPNPCQNDGSCLSVSPTEYRCDCQDGYSGYHCENEDGGGLGLLFGVGVGLGLCAAAFYNRPNIQREQVPQSDDEENPTLPDDVDVSVPITAPPSDTEVYSPVPEGDEVTPSPTQPQQSTQPQTSFFRGDSRLSGLSELFRPRPASPLPGDNTIQMDSIQMDQEQGNSNYTPTPGP